MKKKKIVSIVILIIVLASVIYLYSRLTARRPPDNILRISGNIEAHESVVGFKVQGRLAELPVQEGQYVNEGDPIAGLDRNDYLQQVKMDEAAVRSRKAELALAMAGSRRQEIKA